ncbi:hypothetical protein GGI12_002917 [Dipsacomyces acuminosporus]|nr:hypothetical protein GGI12_002917 [Dipsacomyces acuminosporus]
MPQKPAASPLNSEVIELLSDSSFDSICELEEEPETAEATPKRTNSSTTTARQAIDILSPETPDLLPSPSVVLGSNNGRIHSPTLSIRAATNNSNDNGDSDDELARRRRRQAALDLPSSPPPLFIEDADDSYGDVGGYLDEIIRNTASMDSFKLDLPSSSRLSESSSIGNLNEKGVALNYSDAAATEILGDSSPVSSPSLPPSKGDEYLMADSRGLKGTTLVSNSRYLKGKKSFTWQNEVLEIPSLSSDISPATSRLARRYLDSHSSSISNVHISSETDNASDSISQFAPQAVTRTQQKRAEKERKKSEKEYMKNLSKVNRKKLDKEELAKDITILINEGLLSSMAGTTTTAGRKNQTNSGAGGLTRSVSLPTNTSDITEDDHHQEEEHPLLSKLQEGGIGYKITNTGGSSSNSSIRWQMAMRRKWDGLMGLFIPLERPQSVLVRDVAMVVWDSAKFVSLISRDKVQDTLELERGILAVKRLFVVIVGLTKYLRHVETAESREFAKQLRKHLKGNSNSAAADLAHQPRKETSGSGGIGEDAVEQAIVDLQVTCPWATWFTQCQDAGSLGKLLSQTSIDLALSVSNGFSTSSPSDNDTNDVAAALHAAVVKSGTDLTDSWIRALSQIPKITPNVAQHIVSEYPTPKCLFDSWNRLSTTSEKEQMLAQLVVSSGRKLGTVMSTRIYRLFNETDPARPFAEL